MILETKYTAFDLVGNWWHENYRAYDGIRARIPCKVRLTKNKAVLESFRALPGGRIKTVSKYVALDHLVVLRKI